MKEQRHTVKTSPQPSPGKRGSFELHFLKVILSIFLVFFFTGCERRADSESSEPTNAAVVDSNTEPQVSQISTREIIRAEAEKSAEKFSVVYAQYANESYAKASDARQYQKTEPLLAQTYLRWQEDQYDWIGTAEFSGTVPLAVASGEVEEGIFRGIIQLIRDEIVPTLDDILDTTDEICQKQKSSVKCGI